MGILWILCNVICGGQNSTEGHMVLLSFCKNLLHKFV